MATGLRASPPSRATERPIYARLTTLAVAAVLTLPFLPASATASEVPATARLAATERPAAPVRAGRDYFRVEVRQVPLSAVRAVRVKAVPKRARVAGRPRVARSAPRRSQPRSAPAAVSFTGTGRVSVVVGAALSMVGRPYVWGAAGPRAFDCSGLILWSMARAGIRVPHQSGAIGGMGRAVPRSQWRAGVIVHYAGHVALIVSPTMMVEAPHAGANVRVVKIREGGSGRWLF